jgi:excisionase family DNA binding protein
MTYTTTEAAIVLGLAPETVARYIKRGLIAAQKRGRDYWIEDAELERFQRERQIGPGYPKGKPRKAKDKE